MAATAIQLANNEVYVAATAAAAEAEKKAALDML